jgi:hypothetical protein
MATLPKVLINLPIPNRREVLHLASDLTNRSGSQFQNLDIDVHLIKIQNYIPMGGWLNQPHQYDVMIEHPREHILFT